MKKLGKPQKFAFAICQHYAVRDYSRQYVPEGKMPFGTYCFFASFYYLQIFL